MWHRYLVVWFNPHKQEYYYRLIKWNYNDYKVGFVNQYDHVIVLFDELKVYTSKKLNVPVKKRIKRGMINFLEKI